MCIRDRVWLVGGLLHRGGLRLFLLGLPLLLKFGKVAVDGSYQLVGLSLIHI